jgi:hypothetical protein
MEFSCSQCANRYAIPDERVRGKRIRTKCRKCGSEILIEGPREGGGERVSLPPPSMPMSMSSPNIASLPPSPSRADAQGDPATAPVAPPSGAQRFGFDDEATAVIAPDRARELLEAEAAKADTEARAQETPMGFGFDDATKVTEAPSAEALTASSEDAGATGTPERSSEPPPGREPSIVLDDALGAAKPKPRPPVAPSPSQAPPKSTFPAELAAIQNEPTRVIRTKPKDGNRAFWIVLLLALAAAVTGGLIATKLFEDSSPSPQHGPP